MDLPDNFYDPITVYVPARTASFEHRIDVATIDAGSGIVGTQAGPRLVIYYEGNRFGDKPTFADRVLHAHGRHVMNYPTVARALVDPQSLTPVGLYYPRDRQIEADDLEAIADWIGVAFNDADQLARELKTSYFPRP